MLEVFDYQGQQVRTDYKDEAVWFVAADVCRVLDIINPTMAVGRLDDDEKGLSSIETLGGNQQMVVVNEAGLYSLILTSRKPQAKEFKRWVTHDVLPSIRKHGLYAIDDVLENPDLLIKALTELKKEREEKKRLELENAVKAQQIAEMQPKVSYYDIVLACPDLVTITQIAKDFGMSAKKLRAGHGFCIRSMPSRATPRARLTSMTRITIQPCIRSGRRKAGCLFMNF